jgi:iron complex outermembrane receptor protein
MKNIRSALLIATAAGALITGCAAQAQTAPQGNNLQESSGSAPPVAVGGEDIVVTAQKRAQTLIDVPQSVSVISGTTLESEQATSFQDYLKLIPGLQLVQSDPGSGRLILRGLNSGGVGSTVAVYEDETAFGSSTGLANGGVLAGDIDTFDVARIEVLRGPQGTLYGASALGGVIKFVTNAPDTTAFTGRARGGIETVKGGRLSYFGNAVVNVPLGDTLAFRASGFYRNNGGFIDSIGTGGSRVRNNVNGNRIYGGRASLLFKPIDRLSIKLNALVQNIDTDAPSVEESDQRTLQTLYGRPTQSIYVSPFHHTDYRVYNGTIDYDLGFADLVSSTSLSRLNQTVRLDLTNYLSKALSGLIGVNELYEGQTINLKKFTQEVRLSSNHGHLLDYVLGGYYTHETVDFGQVLIPVVPGTLTPLTAFPTLETVALPSRYEEIAGFGNATLHLGDHFDIDAGGRYSHNKQSAVETVSGPLAGPGFSYAQGSSENVFTYSVAPKIKFSRNASLYGRVAKGYQPGGPNALAPGAPDQFKTYKSSTTLNYEVGVKAQTADHTFGIEVAAFHIDWSRIQLITTTQTNAGNFSFNANGSTAKSDGVEATATLRPSAGFDVSLNGAITNARLTGDTPIGGLRADKLPYTPRYSIGMDSNYRWALTDNVKAFVGGSLRFLSKAPGGFDQQYILRTGQRLTPQIPSYEVVDLRGGLEFGKYSIEAYVKNLNNADGKLSESIIGVYPNQAVGTGVIRPRSVGVALTAGF